MTILNTQFDSNVTKYIEDRNLETIIYFLEDEYELPKKARELPLNEFLKLLYSVADDLSDILDVPFSEAELIYKTFLEDKVKASISRQYQKII